jgi:hypothetical protein
MSLRDRRMDSEWELLAAMSAANPAALVSIDREENAFRLLMQESPAWVGKGTERRIETEHALRYVYPRYYPSLPLEGYFARPISHVNVDPVTGFVCLWKEFQPSQTIVDAILITRAVMAWKTANLDPAHCMQEAESSELPMPSLIVPSACRPIPLQPRRQRLSSWVYG